MRIQEDDPYVNPEGDPFDKKGRSEIHWGHIVSGILIIGVSTYLGKFILEQYGDVAKYVGIVGGAVAGIVMTSKVFTQKKQDK